MIAGCFSGLPREGISEGAQLFPPIALLSIQPCIAPMMERRRQARFACTCSRLCCIVAGALMMLLEPAPCFAYSVLTHQQIVDLAWKDSIRPLLLSKYPHATEAQLREAHAYAYGGCAVQDLGYYPFGAEFFSDLTHYVRSGDFIINLFREARNVNEYAFAIGALSHYLGDSIGHSLAVNRATAIDFPKLEKRYGPRVTYEESPHSHIRTEFGFDVDQLSARRFAPQGYLDFVGFKVARGVLERAFRDTYGLELREVLGPEFPAIRSYRSAVRKFIPLFAYAEVVIHKHHFRQDMQNEAFTVYLDRLSHVDYEKRWSGASRAPGIGAHLIAILIPILPRIGALSMLAIKDPTPETEELYVRSVNRTVDAYCEELDKLRTDFRAIPALPNLDLDTGNPVRPGAYARADATYAKLVQRITSLPGRKVRPWLRRDILEYYADPNAPITTKKNHKAWQRLQAQLAVLKKMEEAEAIIP